MEVIKRHKWKKLFKKRELVHVDAVKEFYAKSTMSHNRKKDVAKSKVRGVEVVFDHLKLASILGIPSNNGIVSISKWDDEIEPQAEEVHEEEAQNDFDWEAVIDEAAVQGKSGSDDQFFDVQVDVEEPMTEIPAAPAFPTSPGDPINRQKERTPTESTPRVHLVTYQILFSFHFKLNLKEPGPTEFKQTWRRLKQKIQDS
ncbi:hypothetical protein Dimus_018232 [Dionaea muscipula]